MSLYAIQEITYSARCVAGQLRPINNNFGGSGAFNKDANSRTSGNTTGGSARISRPAVSGWLSVFSIALQSSCGGSRANKESISSLQ